MGPGLTWLAVFLVVPCGLVFTYSFFERGLYGGIDYLFTFENYTRAIDPLYLKIFLQSLKIATMTTVLALLLGYPAAYFIARAPRSRQNIYLILAILPFWSNYLIRTYAWIVMLNREGLINRVLEGAGMIDEPLPLLYNEFSIIVGLLYAYLPFMILSLYASIARLGSELGEASTDLGGNALKTFLGVTLPLTLPGIGAGCVFVFVLSIGNFITPELLGGGKYIMIGNLIYDQFLSARDWPFGASLAFILIGIMMALLFMQAMLVNRYSGGSNRA
ncbi:MAG: ABC transporter permease [Candidatus Glassbacteria bacterium]|nr:ABC transporter permease [Candidatus Glassbacteria bacterium]